MEGIGLLSHPRVIFDALVIKSHPSGPQGQYQADSGPATSSGVLPRSYLLLGGSLKVQPDCLSQLCRKKKRRQRGLGAFFYSGSGSRYWLINRRPSGRYPSWPGRYDCQAAGHLTRHSEHETHRPVQSELAASLSRSI